MKQAIQEGFIIDVLEQYTPVDSYYRLVKTAEGDPEFDTKRAGKKLRRYVEDNDHAISKKAEIIVDHFPRARARASEDRGASAGHGGHKQYRTRRQLLPRHPSDYLAERKSPYQAIVAFSGEHEYGGAKVTEASLNGFSSNRNRRRGFRKTPTGSWSAPTSSRPATTSRCCTRCTWTRCCPA